KRWSRAKARWTHPQRAALVLMVLGVSSSGILDSRVSLRGSDRCRFAVGALLGSAGALTVPLHWQRDDVIRRELFPGPICHEECKGGEIRDEQGRRISALCATVRGNCAHLSGRGKAGDPARPGAGLVAFGASCASQPANRRISGPDRS